MQQTVITGGLRGIGRGIVDACRARGDRVAVFDCLPTDSSDVQELCVLGVMYITVNVADAGSVLQGFAQLDQQNFVPTVLINNAGITRDNLVLRMSEADWDQVMAVNLKGAFLCSQQALKRMIRQPKSYIVNLASVVGMQGNPGQANYAASKAGLIALTQTLAKEYAARNVLVNAIAPGFIQTTMTDKLPENIKELALQHIPLKRFGQVQDIANLVTFITSGQADYITGHVFVVSGGM